MTIQQWTATQHRDDLRLIPPLAEEFTLYGGTDTVERARKWALDDHLLLADGIPACAHGLYLMASCPKGTCASHFRQLDHGRIWVPAREMNRPFLLCHPYASEIRAETKHYAQAHGLDIIPGSDRDNWYGSGALAIVMTLPDNWPVWPIENKTAILFTTQPVAWPDDDDQDGP
jgi:hypothetical protein